ncbi:MAG: hypothetical protein H7061_04720 [Bdellovibrionaceae bacterium]|nr:hypothetical protein [Bdellovibrio sp.]
MNSAVNKAAIVAAPSLLSRFKLRYLVLGVGAYYALKMLRSRGALPKQADAALDYIDRGIDMAKDRVGLSGTTVAGAVSSLVSTVSGMASGSTTEASTGSSTSGAKSSTKSSKADPQSIHADAHPAGTSSAPGIH